MTLSFFYCLNFYSFVAVTTVIRKIYWLNKTNNGCTSIRFQHFTETRQNNKPHLLFLEICPVIFLLAYGFEYPIITEVRFSQVIKSRRLLKYDGCSIYPCLGDWSTCFSTKKFIFFSPLWAPYNIVVNFLSFSDLFQVVRIGICLKNDFIDGAKSVSAEPLVEFGNRK